MPDHDYIPSADGNLLSFAKNLYAFAPANFARWGVPSPQAVLDTQKPRIFVEAASQRGNVLRERAVAGDNSRSCGVLFCFFSFGGIKRKAREPRVNGGRFLQKPPRAALRYKAHIAQLLSVNIGGNNERLTHGKRFHHERCARLGNHAAALGNEARHLTRITVYGKRRARFFGERFKAAARKFIAAAHNAKKKLRRFLPRCAA